MSVAPEHLPPRPSLLAGLEAKRRMVAMARRNVLRNWRHSLATILAIASGFLAVSLFDGFLKELQMRNTDGFATRGMMGQVLIEKTGAQLNADLDQWKYAIDEQEQEKLESFLKNDPDVVLRVRFLEVTGLVYSKTTSSVFLGHGYDIKEGAAARGDRWAWNTVAGKPLHMATQPSIVIGRSMARLLGCEIASTKDDFILPDGNYIPEDRAFSCKEPRLTVTATTEMAQVNAIDLNLVGLIDAGFREADKRALSMSLEDAQRLLDTKKITMIAVHLKSDDQGPAFIERFKTYVRDQKLDVDIIHWQDHKLAAYVKGGMQLLSVFRNLFMAIVVTIGVMSVFNTMMKSVNERTREIGTLRSLGFLRRELMFVFACEGFFLSLLACVVGFIATLVLSYLIGKLGFTYRAGVLSVPIMLRVKYAPVAWAVSALALSTLATVTAWFCARKASRMVIADAMRHV